jgi:3alpha(or 20beta)-hydroxysteroid dehydrogenase
MKAVVALVEQSGGGSIVNVASTAGPRGSPGAIAYSATNWAPRDVTKAAAVDLAPRKTRVNSIHPGPIDTEMLNVRTPEQNTQRLRLVPMKLMKPADDVVNLVAFLLSDESGYITGADVAIGGGATL